MPLPTPRKNQKEKDFIASCMASETMNKEYPNQKQRYAICLSQFNRKKKKAKASGNDGQDDGGITWNEEDVSKVIIE